MHGGNRQQQQSHEHALNRWAYILPRQLIERGQTPDTGCHEYQRRQQAKISGQIAALGREQCDCASAGKGEQEQQGPKSQRRACEQIAQEARYKHHRETEIARDSAPNQTGSSAGSKMAGRWLVQRIFARERRQGLVKPTARKQGAVTGR